MKDYLEVIWTKCRLNATDMSASYVTPKIIINTSKVVDVVFSLCKMVNVCCLADAGLACCIPCSKN